MGMKAVAGAAARRRKREDFIMVDRYRDESIFLLGVKGIVRWKWISDDSCIVSST